MKKLFFSLLSATVLMATVYTATAQEDNVTVKKQEDIVISKNTDKDVKVTIEIKNDEVLINGKPMSDFKDDNISIRKSKKITRNGNTMFVRPGGGNSFFYNDDSDGETRPLLGVTTDKADNGTKITDVAKGSAAEKAGLKEGDIIYKVETTKIADPEELMDAVATYKPKDKIKVYYNRDGKPGEATATLGERKAGRPNAFSYKTDRLGNTNPDVMKYFNFDMPPVPPVPENAFLGFNMLKNKKLGVKIEDTDNELGVKIIKVEEGSAAGKAGLKKDDIITEIDGENIKNTNDARKKVWSNEKTNYSIKAKRGSSAMSFEIKIPKVLQSTDL